MRLQAHRGPLLDLHGDGKQEEGKVNAYEQGAALGLEKGRHWHYYREEEKEVTRLMQRLNRCARPCDPI